jgi:RNase H-like protein
MPEKARSESKRSGAKPHTGPRILTLDIETAPLQVYCWGLWDQNIGLEMIKSEWTILSYSAKWLHEKRVIFQCTGGRGVRRVRDDKAICRELRKLLDRADIVVTQNGQAFDIRKINSRLIMNGLTPYSPIKIVDTCLVAKRQFGFTSNKLKWLSEKINDKAAKDEHKKFPGFELWAECLKDNPAAWEEMRTYNSMDVISTEELYLNMRPWIVGHPNVAAYVDNEEMACPKCGSTQVQKRGLAYTQTGEYYRIQCLKCRGWSRSRYTINSKEKREGLLSN